MTNGLREAHSTEGWTNSRALRSEIEVGKPQLAREQIKMKISCREGLDPAIDVHEATLHIAERCAKKRNRPPIILIRQQEVAVEIQGVEARQSVMTGTGWIHFAGRKG